MVELLRTRGLVVFLWLGLVGGLDWSYQAIEGTGKFCPQRDSCRYGRSSRSSKTSDWKLRNCFCDPDCAVYGDCCIDATAFNNTQQRDNFDAFSCVNMRQYGDVYMKATCPKAWTNKKINKSCLSSDKKDPFGSLPVTSEKTGFTYRNYYCAVCNTDSENISMWQQRLECPTLQGYNSRFRNISADYLLDNLKMNPNTGEWGVELDTIGIPVFHDCFLDPYLPDTLTRLVRHCNPSKMTSSCPKDYLLVDPEAKVTSPVSPVDEVAAHRQEALFELLEEDELVQVVTDMLTSITLSRRQVAEYCAAYTAVMYSSKSRNATLNTVYRNPHCALCHNETMPSLICLNINEMALGRANFGNGFQPFSFAVLFDIDRRDGKEVGVLNPCGKGELWDPFFRRCRNIVCGEEGRVFVDGKCYNKGEVPSTTTTTTTTTTTSTTTTISTTTTPIVTTTIEITTANTVSDTTTLPVEEVETEAAVTLPDIVFPSDDAILFNTELPAINQPKLPTTAPSSTTTTTPTPTTGTTSTTTTAARTTSSTPETLVTVASTTAAGRDEYRNSTLFQPVNPQLLAECPKIQLDKDEFRLDITTSALSIPVYGLTLLPGEYSRQGESVVICRPDHLVEKFSPVMGYVTFTCLGISMVCLVFHLLVTFLAPELQNLSGKNLFSFSLALLGSYSCFLANMLNTEHLYENCFALALLMYYFYLSAFFWMLNIAFNVARTLKLATTQLRLSTGAQWGKFVLNSIVGWVFPALLAATTAVIDRVDIPDMPSEFKPGFGKSTIGLCWFSSRTALLVYFVAPFCCIMLLNLIFFLWSSCMVWQSSHSTAKITTTGPRISFHLYLRLALLMGLTWLAGLIAGALDLEPVWYVFLVLNTLQGLFILLFFTCSKKVVTSVKERLSTEDRDTSSWRWRSREPVDSQDSNLSTAGLTGKNHRSSYEQYHHYDQRYYSQ